MSLPSDFCNRQACHVLMNIRAKCTSSSVLFNFYADNLGPIGFTSPDVLDLLSKDWPSFPVNYLLHMCISIPSPFPPNCAATQFDTRVWQFFTQKHWSHIAGLTNAACISPPVSVISSLTSTFSPFVSLSSQLSGQRVLMLKIYFYFFNIKLLLEINLTISKLILFEKLQMCLENLNWAK